MDQAKQGLSKILESLTPQDSAAVLAFGSSTKVSGKKLSPCSDQGVGKLRAFTKALGADMGGTEIGGALREAIRVIGKESSADIFLITDGEVNDWNPIVNDARTSGARVFTVGVGSAVCEPFVRELAHATGGQCELVTPGEGMSDRIIRHFERMRAPKARYVRVQWPEGASDVSPGRIGAVFEGDTVVASARFEHMAPVARVVLDVESEAGVVFQQVLPMSPVDVADLNAVSTIARVAAASRLRDLSDEEGLKAAMRYRLVSQWTNCLVIADREEEHRAIEPPALRKVPQTLAAGWGGTGQAHSAVTASRMCLAPSPDVMESRREYSRESFSDMTEARRPRISAQLRGSLASGSGHAFSTSAAEELLRAFGVDLDPLFQSATALGVNCEIIALIALAHLFSGPDLRAEMYSWPLKERIAVEKRLESAEQYEKVLRRLSAKGAALAKDARRAAGLLLIGESDRSVHLDRYEQIGQLLDRTHAAVRVGGLLLPAD